MALGQRRYIGVVSFNLTGCNRCVAGGRLPMELWCDCPRQSINFDSLRGAPPTGLQGRNRGTFTFVTAKPETSVIQALSVSGVEESTTWENEPPQDKNCHLGRFLDSARNDMSEGGTIQPNGLYLPRGQPLAGAGWWCSAQRIKNK